MSTAPSEEPIASEQPVVLVVDDSSLVRRQVANALRGANLQVIEAANGEQALEILSTQSIQLLVTDINMPHMDGIELLNTMDERGLNVAAVVITNEGQVRSLRLARAAGAIAWVTKPFDPATLARSIVRVLSEGLHMRGRGVW
jgi:two-component system, chemotaxis family, chemotaxis protein CheY